MADIEVFKVGSVVWGKYLEKGNAQGLLNGHERELLDIAIKYSNGIYTSLRAKQAIEILSIKSKLVEAGVLSKRRNNE